MNAQSLVCFVRYNCRHHPEILKAMGDNNLRVLFDEFHVHQGHLRIRSDIPAKIVKIAARFPVD